MSCLALSAVRENTAVNAVISVTMLATLLLLLMAALADSTVSIHFLMKMLAVHATHLLQKL